jgi:signal transduction histidine kinase
VVADFQEDYPDVRLETQVSATTDVAVPQSHQLEIALRNAVENAVEHNESEIPWVKVTLQSSPTGTRISIENNGPGIPELERDTLDMGVRRH